MGYPIPVAFDRGDFNAAMANAQLWQQGAAGLAKLLAGIGQAIQQKRAVEEQNALQDWLVQQLKAQQKGPQYTFDLGPNEFPPLAGVSDVVTANPEVAAKYPQFFPPPPVSTPQGAQTRGSLLSALYNQAMKERQLQETEAWKAKQAELERQNRLEVTRAARGLQPPPGMTAQDLADARFKAAAIGLLPPEKRAEAATMLKAKYPSAMADHIFATALQRSLVGATPEGQGKAARREALTQKTKQQIQRTALQQQAATEIAQITANAPDPVTRLSRLEEWKKKNPALFTTVQKTWEAERTRAIAEKAGPQASKVAELLANRDFTGAAVGARALMTQPETRELGLGLFTKALAGLKEEFQRTKDKTLGADAVFGTLSILANDPKTEFLYTPWGRVSRNGDKGEADKTWQDITGTKGFGGGIVPALVHLAKKGTKKEAIGTVSRALSVMLNTPLGMLSTKSFIRTAKGDTINFSMQDRNKVAWNVMPPKDKQLAIRAAAERIVENARSSGK